MESSVIHSVNKKNENIHTLTNKCGCVVTYTYQNCTNNDLINGGCYESCACFKYTITTEKCNICKENLTNVVNLT